METSNSQAFDACLTEALAQMREWIPRWLSTLHETLHQREGVVVLLTEKQAIVQARLQLERHQEIIASRFIEAFAASLKDAQGRAGSSTRSLRSMRFDELELMADEQVLETVEFAQVQQVIKMAADETLLVLNARMSRAQGLDRVRPEANPLRTEVVVSALMQALNGVQVSPSVRSRWLKTGAVALAQELNGAYSRLSDLLGNWGIVPAGYNVIPSPEVRLSTGAFSGGSGHVRAESTHHVPVLGSKTLLTLDHLHKLLVGSQEQGNHNPFDSVDTDAPADSAASGMSNGMVRTLAAEVVTLMMRGIAEDSRLLAPLRAMLAGMEPALLQLARNDPRFFADRNNPARRLLDTVTERSLAFTSEENPGYAAFAGEVQGIVRALHAPGADLPARFPALLSALNRSQSNSIAPAQVEARGLAVQTLVRVEQRNLLAERVVTEIASRNDFSRVPSFVRRFLSGPWSQVVAQARIDAAAQTASPNTTGASVSRYVDILPDLLWSSQLDLASRNRPRLIKVIPNVLRTLREGLESIDYPTEQTETFFQALMDLHMGAYKTLRADPPAEAQPSRQFEAAPEPSMQPMEARNSGFMDDLAMDDKPAFADTQLLQRDWADIKAEMATQHSQALPVGTWVDIWQDGQALRCKMTWASPHGTMFLFTATDGRSISLTMRGLERLLEQDRLRVVAEHGVVDAALDAVARQAWINSAKQ